MIIIITRVFGIHFKGLFFIEILIKILKLVITFSTLSLSDLNSDGYQRYVKGTNCKFMHPKTQITVPII